MQNAARVAYKLAHVHNCFYLPITAHCHSGTRMVCEEAAPEHAHGGAIEGDAINIGRVAGAGVCDMAVLQHYVALVCEADSTRQIATAHNQLGLAHH
jgi:hypothetical protein